MEVKYIVSMWPPDGTANVGGDHRALSDRRRRRRRRRVDHRLIVREFGVSHIQMWSGPIMLESHTIRWKHFEMACNCDAYAV